MGKNVLIIDSDYEEAKDFVKGLEDETHEEWKIALYENNKIYGIKRYIKFFTVALKIVIQRNKYSGKIVLCWQQFYGVAIAFFCRLFRLKPSFQLVIMTFIYKPKNGIIGKLFYEFVKYAITSKYVTRIICTSKNEIEYYSKTFGLSEDIFTFVKWGAVDHSKTVKVDEKLKEKKYYFSTGRSNRDYDFLIKSFKDTNYNLLIACDTIPSGRFGNIEVRDDLFDENMLRYMKNSIAVVIALDNDEIAAGQLVLLHAMNLGVPVIITKSHGVTDDYVIDHYNGLIIKKTKEDLYKAIKLLEDDLDLYKQMSKNSKKEFENNYTKYILGKNIGKVVKANGGVN